jgi:hypothetical protein
MTTVLWTKKRQSEQSKRGEEDEIGEGTEGGGREALLLAVELGEEGGAGCCCGFKDGEAGMELRRGMDSHVSMAWQLSHARAMKVRLGARRRR